LQLNVIKFKVLHRSCIISGKPRSYADNIGDVNIVNASITKTDPFQVIAYPGPLALSFGYFGKLENAITTLPLPEGITMTGSCVQRDQIYRHECRVTVSNVNREDQAGFYQVQIYNSQGATILRFQVLYNGQY
jgi:hypothetical protein